MAYELKERSRGGELLKEEVALVVSVEPRVDKHFLVATRVLQLVPLTGKYGDKPRVAHDCSARNDGCGERGDLPRVDTRDNER